MKLVPLSRRNRFADNALSRLFTRKKYFSQRQAISRVSAPCKVEAMKQEVGPGADSWPTTTHHGRKNSHTVLVS